MALEAAGGVAPAVFAGFELRADVHARALDSGMDLVGFDVGELGELRCDAVWSPGQERSGPENLEAILVWPWHAAQRILQHAKTQGVEGFEGSLRKVLANVQVTTSYSGMGCAEGVLPLLKDAFSSLGIEASFTTFSATDVSRECREVLCDHKDAPRHVFGDILERLLRQTRIRLENLGAHLRAKLERRVLRRGGCESGEGRRFRRQMVRELGEQHLSALRTTLSAVDFASAGACQCARHGAPCSADARPSNTADGGVAPSPPSLWVEVAGTTCVAWSSMGAGLGWLDGSALPCLVWLFWVRFQQPDIVIHECTTRFDEAVLVELLGDMYDVESLNTSPPIMGIPSMRLRKYTMCLRRASGSASASSEAGVGVAPVALEAAGGVAPAAVDAAGGVAPAAPPCAFRFERGLYESLFRRALRVTGDVYLAAREDRVAKHVQGEMRRRPYCLSGDDGLDRDLALALLPPMQRGHLAEYRRRLGDGRPGVDGPLFVNLMQSPGHMGEPGGGTKGLVPCLMRGSVLFSLGKNRLVLPEEHLVVQGVPVPELLPADSWLAKYYPLSRPVDAFPGALWRRLSGNGMHWSQIGTALLLAFARAAEVGVTRVAPRPCQERSVRVKKGVLHGGTRGEL